MIRKKRGICGHYCLAIVLTLLVTNNTVGAKKNSGVESQSLDADDVAAFDAMFGDDEGGSPSAAPVFPVSATSKLADVVQAAVPSPLHTNIAPHRASLVKIVRAASVKQSPSLQAASAITSSPQKKDISPGGGPVAGQGFDRLSRVESNKARSNPQKNVSMLHFHSIASDSPVVHAAPAGAPAFHPPAGAPSPPVTHEDLKKTMEIVAKQHQEVAEKQNNLETAVSEIAQLAKTMNEKSLSNQEITNRQIAEMRETVANAITHVSNQVDTLNTTTEERHEAMVEALNGAMKETEGAKQLAKNAILASKIAASNATDAVSIAEDAGMTSSQFQKSIADISSQMDGLQATTGTVLVSSGMHGKVVKKDKGDNENKEVMKEMKGDTHRVSDKKSKLSVHKVEKTIQKKVEKKEEKKVKEKTTGRPVGKEEDELKSYSSSFRKTEKQIFPVSIPRIHSDRGVDEIRMQHKAFEKASPADMVSRKHSDAKSDVDVKPNAKEDSSKERFQTAARENQKNDEGKVKIKLEKKLPVEIENSYLAPVSLADFFHPLLIQLPGKISSRSDTWIDALKLWWSEKPRNIVKLDVEKIHPKQNLYATHRAVIEESNQLIDISDNFSDLEKKDEDIIREEKSQDRTASFAAKMQIPDDGDVNRKEDKPVQVEFHRVFEQLEKQDDEVDKVLDGPEIGPVEYQRLRSLQDSSMRNLQDSIKYADASGKPSVLSLIDFSNKKRGHHE